MKEGNSWLKEGRPQGFGLFFWVLFCSGSGRDPAKGPGLSWSRHPGLGKETVPASRGKVMPESQHPRLWPLPIDWKSAKQER